MGNNTANVFEQFALRGPHDIHQMLIRAPRLTGFQHFLKQTLPRGERRKLKILAARIAGERQHNYPLSRITQERFHAVFAHIGCHGQRIYGIGFEKRFGIARTGIADVAALGIGDDEMVRTVHLQIVDGAFKGLQSLEPVALIKSQVGFVGHTKRCRCIDDGLVEFEDRVVRRLQMCGNLLHIGIQTDTEKRLLLKNLRNKFLLVHTLKSFAQR